MRKSQPYLWFPYLVSRPENKGSSVYGTFSREQLKHCSIVRLNNYKSGKNSYAVFDNYAKLCRYIVELPQHHRLHHEVKPGNQNQKISFDVDMKSKRVQLKENETQQEYYTRVIDELLQHIVNILSEKDIIIIPEKQIAIFTSHGPEKDYIKYSCHIIVDGYYHSNSYQAECFYKEISTRFSNDLAPFVDGGIYSKNHCMRLLWNHKLNSTRSKIHETTFIYKGKQLEYQFKYEANNVEHRLIQTFGLSLVCMTAGCKPMPSYEECQVYDTPTPISERCVREALYIWALFCGIEIKEMPFRYRGIKDSIISVDRLRPSMCAVCLREHVNRPPALLIQGKNLYWYCRGLIDTQGSTPLRDEIENQTGVRAKDRVLIGILTTCLEVSSDASNNILEIRKQEGSLSNKIAIFVFRQRLREKSLEKEKLLEKSLEKEIVDKLVINEEIVNKPVDNELVVEQITKVAEEKEVAEFLMLKNPRTGRMGIQKIILKPKTSDNIDHSIQKNPYFNVKFCSNISDNNDEEELNEKKLTPSELIREAAKTARKRK